MERWLVTLGVLVYALVVPILEINDTHVFNPEWPAHARLHEVWQLTTNSAIGALSLWMVWARRDVVLPGVLALLVMGGFLVAYVFQDSYGGSMQLAMDQDERTLAGVSIGLLGVCLVVATSCVALTMRYLSSRSV
jgi:hypothetical protein